MRFALLGDHPDGLDLARALVQAGHDLRCYSGPPVGRQYLQRWGLQCEQIPDLEEALAQSVDAVIIAGGAGDRANQLRRAVQSEHHVLCVHPCAPTPDIAYEAGMVQRDTGKVLLPLLTEALHPALVRFAAVLKEMAASAGFPPHPNPPPPGGRESEAPHPAPVSGKPQATVFTPSSPSTPRSPEDQDESPASFLRLLEWQRWSTERILFDSDVPGHHPGLPGWDVLRLLGGEVVEVSLLGRFEDPGPDDLLLLSGRCAGGMLFQVTLLPNQREARWHLIAHTATERVELSLPEGWPVPARLTWTDESGQPHEENWESWNPWESVVEVIETTIDQRERQPLHQERLFIEERPVGPLSWQDEVRCLELDDAARRSLERRRVSVLEYQDATEEASFKGTMTLVGCSMVWVSLLLLILSRWLPWLGWLILPVFGFFLALQLLRWVIPPRQGQ